MISLEKYHLGLAKIGLNSEVILILGGLNREILLYRFMKITLLLYEFRLASQLYFKGNMAYHVCHAPLEL